MQIMQEFLGEGKKGGEMWGEGGSHRLKQFFCVYANGKSATDASTLSKFIMKEWILLDRLVHESQLGCKYSLVILGTDEFLPFFCTVQTNLEVSIVLTDVVL